tara:strand:- start:754 stop:939 length:186 start_codon:yes stop_codon:yes gene_type:complete
MPNDEFLSLWEELKVLVESLEDDITKNALGNQSAGVRARKALRLLKQKSQNLVKSSLENRK